MKAQVEREQATALKADRVEQLRLLAPQCPPAGPPAVPDKVDWVSHKKEGMRLKRLMEESADGATKFPYMAKMWAGSKEDRVQISCLGIFLQIYCDLFGMLTAVQDRRQLLREWVEKNGDAAAIEACIVISKTSSSRMGTKRELLTVGERVARNFPREKISAIVAKGGIPDADCPHLPELFKYWCQTSCVLKDEEEVKQETRMKVQCQPSAAAMDAMMTGPKGPKQRCALPFGQLDQMMQSVQPAAVPGLHFLLQLHRSISRNPKSVD